MGVCYLQHRIVCGIFANKCKTTSPTRSRNEHNITENGEGGLKMYWKSEIRRVLYSLVLTLYVLLLATLFIVAAKLPESKNYSTTFENLRLVRISTSGINFGIRHYTSCWTLACIVYLIKMKKMALISITLGYGIARGRLYKSVGTFAKLQIFLSFWITILNLTLIIITLPAITNPGPPQTRSENLTCLYQNVRGFVPFSGLSKKIPPLDRNKLNDFQSYVYENKPGIVLLTETWLTKEHLNNEIFPNDSYQCFRLDRSAKTHPPDPLNKNKFREKGGGVLIAVRSDINVEPKIISIKSKAELLSVELCFGNKDVICITVCYRVGTLGELNFLEIEKHLRSLAQKKKYAKHIIVGDFNLNRTSWSPAQSPDRIERLFLDLFSDLGLEQLINRPTHQGGKILDLVLTSRASLLSEISISSQYSICSSDHYGIEFKMKAKVDKIIHKRKVLNYKKANWEGLNKALNSVKWDSVIGHEDPETAWRKFQKILSTLISNFIPSVVVKDHNHPPWFDKETYNMHKKKDRLRKKYKETESIQDYERYSDCRKQFKILLNEKMRSHVEDESDTSLISKKFWKYLKSTSGGTRIPETINYGSRFRNKPQEQSELFNEFFCDQFSDISSYDIDIDYQNDCQFDIVFDFRKIRSLLKAVNPNKAAGPDGIHGTVLKNCAVSLAYPLSLIFRTSYNSGMIPKDWKIANVVPVHKKGSKMSVENYRPISLTSLVMKIFEKVIRDDLMNKCEEKLSQNQHGFLPNKSCTTQMISFSDSIATTINSSMRTDVVYFDFAKAFDSVNHDIILAKLKNRFQIDGTMLKFLVNYLQDREQCVIISGHKSNTAIVRSGVPQGSILGPLLFVLFIDDMAEVVSGGTNIALYADDTKIWRKISTWEDHEILQKDIDSLNNWSIENKMKFHPQKCKVVPIAPMEKGLQNLFNKIFPLQRIFFYRLGDIELEYVQEEKDLGVIVNSKFTWDQQIDALLNKASSRLGLLKRTMHFVKCPKQRRAFYLAIVRSQFEHCAQIWRPSSETLNIKIERIQRRAVKWILSEQDHSYNDLEYLMRLRDLDLLPMKARFLSTDLMMFYDIYSGLSCVKLPGYLRHFTHDERRRLRTNIKPPPSLQGNQSIDLQKMRQSRIDGNSLKSEIEPKSAIFKSSFFYRSAQEWNNLPSEIKEAPRAAFKEKLLKHIKEITFKFDELE